MSSIATTVAWPWRRLDSVMILAGAVALAVLLAATVLLAPDVGDALTRNTIRLSLVWYALALVLLMQCRDGDWLAATYRGRLARWCWTWGLACFLVHLAMAFQFYHHWSHVEAFEHTRAASGTGEGLYLSYLFSCLWLVDVLWWWRWPAWFAARSIWIDRALHGFMLFMVFNGMIVYESGPIRWAGVAMFLGLAAAWVRFRRLPRPARSMS